MTNNLGLNSLEAYVGEGRFHKKWPTFFILGIILLILGILAIIGANYTTLTSIVFFGILLAIGGLFQIIYAFLGREGQGFTHTLLSGLFYTIVGFVFISHPTATAVTVTLLLAAFFCITGIFKIIISLIRPVIQWEWLLFSGIVSLVLGLFIWAEWPAVGLWLIGLFIGLDLIFAGWFWIMLGMVAKKLPRP
jgi:uncharacterized membrane protein HdeD (DUF308 family)